MTQNRLQSMQGGGEQIAVQSMDRKWGICGIGHERNETSKPFLRCFTCKSRCCCHVEQLAGEMKDPNIQPDSLIGAFITAFDTSPELRRNYEKNASNMKKIPVYKCGRNLMLYDILIPIINFSMRL